MKEFYIDDDGVRLHAKLEMPEGRERCPLMILLPGFTGDMEEAQIIGFKDAALRAGCAALRVELYGHGKSGGSFEEHTLFKWFSNVMKVTDYAKELPFVTGLYLAGHSQGGLMAMLAAGMRPDDYEALVLLAPALIILDAAREGEMLGQRFDPEHLPARLHMWGHTLSPNYLRCAQLLHAGDFIGRFKKPTLLVHGDRDEAVPVRYSIEAARHYERGQLALIPGDDHCYGRHLDEAARAVESFLKERETGL